MSARPRVILVEDDASVQRFVALALEDLPIDLVACDSVAAALAALAQAPACLVLTDLMLPGEPGQALVERLARDPALRGSARVAVFSAGLTPAVRDRLAGWDVWRLLSKPVSLAELEACVLDALKDGPLGDGALGTGARSDGAPAGGAPVPPRPAPSQPADQPATTRGPCPQGERGMPNEAVPRPDDPRSAGTAGTDPPASPAPSSTASGTDHHHNRRPGRDPDCPSDCPSDRPSDCSSDSAGTAAQGWAAAQSHAIQVHFGGDAALYRAFRASCLPQFRRDAAAGDAALRAGDAAALRRLAHSLKSVLASLGEAPPSALAAHLEQAGAAGDLPACTAGWPPLRQALLHLADGSPAK